MQNSKKRNKRFTHLLVLALGFVCFLSIAGCTQETNPKGKKKEKKMVDISKHYASFVMGDEDVTIFVKNNQRYTAIGKYNQGASIALAAPNQQNMHQAYFKVEGKNWYVLADKLRQSDQPHTETLSSAYQPFPFMVNMHRTFTMYDTLDNPVMTLSRYEMFPVYVVEANRYGVSYQGKMYYVHQSDVAMKVQNDRLGNETIASSVPVLMYHFFYDASKGEVAKDGNFTEVSAFRQQLQYLKDQGYTTITMNDVDRFMDRQIRLKPNVVAITMDDGSPTVYQNAFPVLKEFQMHATAFLITGWNQSKDVAMYQEMAGNGIELQSHSDLMHQGGCQGMGHGGRLLCVDDATGVQDTLDSFAKVGNGFVYCYPFGDVNEHAKQIIKAGGAHLAFTTKYGKISPDMDKLELPRVRISGGISIESFAARLK